MPPVCPDAPMAPRERELWQALQTAALEIIDGTRKLRAHAHELAPAELRFLENLERLVPDAGAVAADAQARLVGAQ